MSEHQCVPKDELEVIMKEAAQRGAETAICHLLDIDEEDIEERKRAKRDFTELRDLLDVWRGFKQGATRQLGKVVIWALVLLLLIVTLNFKQLNWSPFN